MSEGNLDPVRHFTSITGTDDETAAFFLESCNGDLEMALHRFLEDSDHYQQARRQREGEQDHQPQPERQASPDGDAVFHDASDGGNPLPESPQQGGQPAGRSDPKPRGTGGSGNVRGLADLSDRSDKEKDADDDPDDNEYYTGGEKSGTTVRGGGARGGGGGGGDAVDGLFESAKRHGAVAGNESDMKPGGDSGGVRAFSGRARTLSGEQRPPATPQSGGGSGSEPAAHVITFYANGVFTVNDGEPREIRDPANADFIAALGRGECPRELEQSDGRPVNVNLIRKGTDYTPPEKPKYVAFGGEARSLTEGQPSSSGEVQGSESIVAQVTPGGRWEGPDESQPTTSIQIRLHDGSRMVAMFNHSQTVRDIRRFIAASRPDMPVGYSLVTSFPTKALTDDTQTIEEAGLINAVIIQKM